MKNIHTPKLLAVMRVLAISDAKKYQYIDVTLLAKKKTREHINYHKNKILSKKVYRQYSELELYNNTIGIKHCLDEIIAESIESPKDILKHGCDSNCEEI